MGRRISAGMEPGHSVVLACMFADLCMRGMPGGEPLGRVTSGGFGYAVGSSIAFAYVPREHAEPGTRLEVDIFGDWVAAEVRPEPLYDPAGERVRA